MIDPVDPGPHVVFAPADATQALEWITVLSATGCSYRLSREAGAWRLHVPLAQSTAAEWELGAYESERNASAPQAAARPSPAGRMHLWMAFWCAHALFLIYLWLGPYTAAHPALAAAGAHSGRIVDGEWWRAVTALTLHAGWPHLLGNMMFLFAAGQAVFHALGHGTGLLVLTLAGFSGNMAAAYAASESRVSVGASTLCFAALGVMVAWQTAGQWRGFRQRATAWRNVWVPLMAGLALLGILGTGPQSDLAAHGLGFVFGVLFAVPCSMRRMPRVSRAGQWMLTGLTAVVFLVAWGLALLHG